MTDEISTLKGVFVFSATIIGAGILALPVAGATTGLFPMFLILWMPYIVLIIYLIGMFYGTMKLIS